MTVHSVSTSSVLIAPDHTETRGLPGPRYSPLLSSDPGLIEAAQRLRYEVFSTEPGFTLDNADSLDADRFDEHCDHILVREDSSGELVGCYRMLPRPAPSRPEGSTPQPNSRFLASIRCGRRWSRWAAPWYAAITATGR